MSTAAVAARHISVRRPSDSPGSFLAALAMHAALVGWMWFAVQWHTSASASAVAELWELPAPTPAPVVEPTPPQPAAPLPPPPAEDTAPVKADIVQKQEAPHRKVPAAPRELPTKKDKKAREAQRQPTLEEVLRQQEQAEEQHQQEMQRLASAAGATRRTPSVASVAPLSNEYSARIQAAVRAHLSFAVPDGVPRTVYAEFLVELLPTGEQAAEPRLIKPSGLPGFDEAAQRAILRTDPFPKRDDGTVPRSLSLQLYPQDAR